MKQMIRKILVGMNSIFLLAILLVVFIIHTFKYRMEWEQQTHTLFAQVEQILEQNAKEREELTADYCRICLNYADAVAYILNKTPEIVDDIAELEKIAGYLQIDEINIFDAAGVIVNGTEPKYFGVTVYDGEQIGFFEPMLADRSLRLCQNVLPNTAEKKMMQYAAVWTVNGDYIVQVGTTLERVQEITKKNQLEYIFTLFASDDATELYAVDKDTGEILGATREEMVGKSLSGLGLRLEQVQGGEKEFRSTISGKRCYGFSMEGKSLILLRTNTMHSLYQGLLQDVLIVAACLVLIAGLMIAIIEHFFNRHIVRGIDELNEGLLNITRGDFRKDIEVNNIPEFELLSSRINRMKESILGATEKMSYVLNQVSLPMGVYEYDLNNAKVQVTEQVKSILELEDAEAEELFADFQKFEMYIEGLKRNPIKEFASTYRLDTQSEKYIRLECFCKNDAVMGILIDVTNNVLRSRRIEKERDLDKLTGLFNRRALEVLLENLYENPQELGHSVLIMLDADGLKQINDRYEHKTGDEYLCAIARLLESIEAPNRIIARQGGDEFVICYYGCDSDETLKNYVAELGRLRDTATFTVQDTEEVPIRYSFGYTLCYGREGQYSDLLREADLKMYEDKKSRKAAAKSR